MNATKHPDVLRKKEPDAARDAALHLQTSDLFSELRSAGHDELHEKAAFAVVDSTSNPEIAETASLPPAKLVTASEVERLRSLRIEACVEALHSDRDGRPPLLVERNPSGGERRGV